MTYEEIDSLIQESSKSYLDDSHQAVHGKLQDALTSEHRSAYDGSDYGSYPQVHHVFGDSTKGKVVYKQGDSHYRAPYKMDGGGYTIGEPEAVQVAYVPATTSVSEALTGVASVDTASVYIEERFISTAERSTMAPEDFAGKSKSFPIKKAGDVRAALDSIGRAGNGNHPPEELKNRILAIAKRKGFAVPTADKKESNVDYGETGTIILQESATSGKDMKADLVLIRAGRGSSGYYTEEALKKAADEGIFHEGLKIFLNHQTKEERKARPEGDVTKQAGILTGRAVYVKESGKPGVLKAPGKIYRDFAPFVEARKNDIGMSVRVGVNPTTKVKEGLPLVESICYSLSTDIVTTAGAGGKIEEMYESFRSTQAGHRSEDMTEQETKDFKTLQESNAKLAARLDRQDEEINRFKAERLVNEALVDTGLSERGNARVAKLMMESLPVKDGVLDVKVLQESIKAAVKDELAYLQESGARVSPFKRRAGGFMPPAVGDKDDSKVIEESAARMDDGINVLLGRPKEKKTA